MTLQETKEYEDGLHDLALRSSIRDMSERLGPEKLADILADELKRFGLKVVANGQR